jgi:hypothetical protein
VTPMLEAAERLAALGLAVHWLRGPNPPKKPTHAYRADCTCPPECRWIGEDKWRDVKPEHSPDAECNCGVRCVWTGVGKSPIARGWQHAPAASAAELRQSYRAGLNLGIHTGLVEGADVCVVVVDLDSEAALAEAKRRLPPTPIRSITSSGEHWYYRHPETGRVGNKAHLEGFKLDIRGDGGQVVCAPSVHPTGHGYREAEPWTAERLEAMPAFDLAWFPEAAPPERPPAPIVQRARAAGGRLDRWAQAALKAEADGVANAPEGGRNDTLVRAAYAIGQIVGGGFLSEAEGRQALREGGRACGLPEGEVEDTIERGMTAGKAQPRKAPEDRPLPPARITAAQPEEPPPPPEPPQPPGRPKALPSPDFPSTLMSDVQPELVYWFWRGRIPLGMISLVEGEPDMGKSTLLLDIAARATTGRPMPGEDEGGAPIHVLLWAPEDPAAQVIRPRLDAAGADSTRIRLITGPMTLPDDAERLERAIRADAAQLVIIEPLTAALSGRVDSFKDHDVRRGLMPLADVAARVGCAVVAIRHLRKGDGPAIHRGGGSIAISALARSVLAVGKDPSDETARVIARTKGNLAELPPALRYRFVSSGHVARVEWLGECAVTADELLAVKKDKPREHGALQEAMNVLRSILAEGPVLVEQAEEQAAETGVSKGTLRRAKAALGVRSKKNGGSWLWALPVGSSS